MHNKRKLTVLYDLNSLDSIVPAQIKYKYVLEFTELTKLLFYLLTQLSLK